MIEWMEIHGIKSVRKLRLDLRPVNVLVGSNGAGKSNFVDFSTSFMRFNWLFIQHSEAVQVGSVRMINQLFTHPKHINGI